MDYTFPVIENLDQVLAAIQGRTADHGGEFVVSRRGDHVVVDYVFTTPDSFPDPLDNSLGEIERIHAAIRRECRGLIFDVEMGQILRRPFHKFFCLGQKPETTPGNPHFSGFSRPHVLLEKLDGSMIAPWRDLSGEIHWGTRMGETDVAAQAKKFAETHVGIQTLVLGETAFGCTPIFEWCSLQNRVVVEHTEDRLVLTAVRDLRTGAYSSYTDLCRLGTLHGIEVVRQHALHRDMNEVSCLSDISGEVGLEGYVCRFADGHMIKLKTEWYALLHAGISKLANEKDILHAIVTGVSDDLGAILAPEHRVRLETFEAQVLQGMSEISAWAKSLVAEYQCQHSLDPDDVRGDKKRFAQWILSENFSKNRRSLLFSTWDGRDPVDHVRDLVIKHSNSQSKVDEVRDLIGNAKWVSIRMNEDAA